MTSLRVAIDARLGDASRFRRSDRRALWPKDWDDLAYDLELGVDWVALSRAITVHAGMTG